MLFVTLGQLISQNTSIQTLVSAIRKGGIYTFDAVDLLVKADKDDLQIVSDLLIDQYDYNKDYGAYVERTGTPLSPLELCEEGPQNAEEAKDWVNPYDQFGWPKALLPDFDNIDTSQIEEEPTGFGKANRKAPDAFVAAFVRLLVEIAKRDSKINLDKMPGTKSDLLELAMKYDERLDHKLSKLRGQGQIKCK